MAWCPVCKNEYVKGYTRCSDCGVELVESLEDIPKPIIFGEENAVRQMEDFLLASGITGTSVQFDEKENAFELYVPNDKMQESKILIGDLLRKQAEQARAAQLEMAEQESSQGETHKAPDRRKGGSYEDKNVKADEYRSSAVALLTVGILGVIFLVLFWMDMLPFNMNGMGKIMFSGVMGFMFVMFIVMGINSIKMYKTYLGVASKENTLIDDVNAFLEANLSKSQIDSALHISASDAENDEAQAQLYFSRMEYMKKELLTEFPDLDLPLADKMADDWYSKQFD